MEMNDSFLSAWRRFCTVVRVVLWKYSLFRSYLRVKNSIEFEIWILYGRARSNSNKSEFRIVILAEHYYYYSETILQLFNKGKE